MEHTFLLSLGYLGPDDNTVVSWRANNVCGLDVLDQLRNVFLIDGFLHEDSGSTGADLAHVVEDTPGTPFDGLLQVAVFEDHVGGLTTTFQGDGFQVDCSLLLNDLADGGGTCECNLVDAQMLHDGTADSGTGTRDNVEDTRWEASLLHKVSKEKDGQWGLVCRLEHGGVTGCDGRPLPRHHGQWVVEWDDTANHTQRLV